MKKLFFLAIILLASTFWGDGRVAAQIANQPGPGNCLQFNGTTDFVEILADPSLNTQTLTFDCWLFVNTLITWNTILEYGNGLTDGVYFMITGPSNVFSPNSISVDFVDITSVSHHYICPPNIIPTGKWFHLAITRDAATIQVFVNGVAQTTTLISGTPLTAGTIIQTSYDIQLAIRKQWMDSQFNGLIDEVCIWNRALTQAEIQENMCSKLPDCADPNLVGYWRFDEGIDNTCSGGQDVCDASCNGNNGVKY